MTEISTNIQGGILNGCFQTVIFVDKVGCRVLACTNNYYFIVNMS